MLVEDNMLGQFEARITKEPKWPTKRVSLSFSSLLYMEEVGVHRIDRSIQTSLNNLAFSIAREYNPSIAHVKGIGENSLVFEKSGLFPIHSLEWVLSILELYVHHRRELSWIGNVMFARANKVMKKRYGLDMSERILNICDVVVDQKRMDWNVSIIEVLGVAYDTNSLEDSIRLVSEMTCDPGRTPWSTKDLGEIYEACIPVLRMSDLSRKTKIGILFFTMLSQMGVKLAEKTPTEPDNIEIALQYM